MYKTQSCLFKFEVTRNDKVMGKVCCKLVIWKIWEIGIQLLGFQDSYADFKNNLGCTYSQLSCYFIHNMSFSFLRFNFNVWKTKKKKKKLKNALTFLSLLDTSAEHKTPSSICFIFLSKPKNLKTLTPSTSWSQSEKFKSLQVCTKCEKLLQQWLLRKYHLQPHLSKVISRP